MRQHENFHKMLSIQNSFTGSTAPKILAPGINWIVTRRFIQMDKLFFNHITYISIMTLKFTEVLIWQSYSKDITLNFA